MRHESSAISQLRVVVRHAWRTKMRQWREGRGTDAIDHDTFRETLEKIISEAPSGLVADHAFAYVPGNRPPWLDTKIDLAAGERVTLIAAGRVYLSKFFDLWFAPRFQLWARVGATGRILNGTRDTNTFTAESDGRLYLGNYGPGEWADETGTLATPEDGYASAKGGISVLIIRWAGDPLEGLRALSAHGDCEGLFALELDRLQHAEPRPRGWEHLWFLGPSETYRDAQSERGEASIACDTHGDVDILRKDAPFALTPETELRWDWKVDRLPSAISEITLPTHDYMSIAVEFDNGQDLTYYWSAELPPETIYRCPLPTWKARETHIVVRSGKQGLGEWLNERRNVYRDCEWAYGEAPANIVRVWLIANSLCQRQHGQCEYANVELVSDSASLKVI